MKIDFLLSLGGLFLVGLFAIIFPSCQDGGEAPIPRRTAGYVITGEDGAGLMVWDYSKNPIVLGYGDDGTPPQPFVLNLAPEYYLTFEAAALRTPEAYSFFQSAKGTGEFVQFVLEYHYDTVLTCYHVSPDTTLGDIYEYCGTLGPHCDNTPEKGSPCFENYLAPFDEGERIDKSQDWMNYGFFMDYYRSSSLPLRDRPGVTFHRITGNSVWNNAGIKFLPFRILLPDEGVYKYGYAKLVVIDGKMTLFKIAMEAM